MLEWTRTVLVDRRPALIFAQETFPAWLELVDATPGYEVITGVDNGWSVHSALVYEDTLNLERLDDSDLANLRYHGSYLAAARWRRPDGTSAIVASVHASPSYAEPDVYGWPASADVPIRRHGGADPRWPNDRHWDSDYLLVTLRDLGSALRLPLVAAGDLNEALKDDPPEGTWAKEYFQSAKKLGLRAWLHEVWSEEMPTRGGLQLDHVLVSGGGETLLQDDPPPSVDTAWSTPDAQYTLSDHAAIWFALAPLSD